MSPRKKANTERVSTFLSKEDLADLEKEAEEAGMTVSGLIRMIILTHLANK